MKHQEAPKNYIQETHGHCQRPVEQGRLSVTGDSVQSPHPSQVENIRLELKQLEIIPTKMRKE